MLYSNESSASKYEEDTSPFLISENTTTDELKDWHYHEDFDPGGDPRNPLEWPYSYKRGIVVLLAASAFSITFNCMSVIPIAHQITEDIGKKDDSNILAALPVTIWELGEAAGCLLIAPLSESIGRYPVINTCNVVYIFMTITCAVSKSMPQFIVCRALTGIVVTSNVLNPAIIGDIFAPEHRGTALSIIQIAPILGGTIGAAVSGAISEFLGWRFVLGTSILLAGTCQLALFIYYRETYKPIILRPKTAALHDRSTGRPCPDAFTGPADLGRESTSLVLCLLRPALVIYDSGVLAALAVFGSVLFAHYCVQNVTLPPILEKTYGLSPAEAGMAFLANGAGSIVGIVICRFTIDNIYLRLRAVNKGVGLPEHRLPMVIVAALMMPLALALYGCCAEYKLPLPILLASVAWTRLSIVLGLVPLMAYAVDACGLYAASAATGIIVFRCIGGAFLPLVTVKMADWVGYGLAYSGLSAVSLGLSLIPIFIMRFGTHWRQRSAYTSCFGGRSC